MRITTNILKRILEEEFGDKIHKQGDEWVLNSLANSKKRNKFYINVEKLVAIDFIGNHSYKGSAIIQAVKGFSTVEEADAYVYQYIMDNIREVGYKDFLSQNKEDTKVSKIPPPVARIPLPESAIAVTGDSLTAKWAMSYLEKRGVSRAIAEQFHIMVGTKGEYSRRIIFPFIENNEIVWFQARAMSDRIQPKYINPPDVAKSMLVYNIDAIKERAIITEGVFDAISSNGVAILGASASDWQVSKIMAKKPTEIVIVPDNDDIKIIEGRKVPAAGYYGSLHTIEKFVENGYPLKQIKVAFVDGAKDLNELGREKSLELIESASKITLVTLLKFKAKGANSDLLIKLV